MMLHTRGWSAFLLLAQTWLKAKGKGYGEKSFQLNSFEEIKTEGIFYEAI